MKVPRAVLELRKRQDFNTYYYITKGIIPLNIARGVTDLVLCTLSDHGLHLYQVSKKYLEWFKSYGADTILALIITRGTIP